MGMKNPGQADAGGDATDAACQHCVTAVYNVVVAMARTYVVNVYEGAGVSSTLKKVGCTITKF
jgi:hypothetical protein